MPTLETYKGTYLWLYIPSLPLAIIFAIIFLILTLLHTYKILKHRTWYCIPFVIGGFLEPLGYASRAISHSHTGLLVPYLLQAIFLLLPPCLFAATLYMVYSRIVRSLPHGSRYSTVSPRWCTRIFIAGDMLCLNIQSGGAGLLPHDKLAQEGKMVVVCGLALQIVVFAGFMVCCVVFHRRYRGFVSGEGAVQWKWERTLYMLYGTSVIISVRNVFRLIEFVAGDKSYLLRNEWPVYVFDGAAMVVVMLVFLIWYSPMLGKERDGESMTELVGGQVSR